MKQQLKSFACAFRGLWDAVCDESHLRFHLVAGFYVLLLAPLFGVSRLEYAVLIVLIAAVIAAELVNTAIEDVSDALTRQQNAFIRLAKDIAAGAVLILAIAAVAVAVLFFAKWEAILGVFRFFEQHIVLAVLLVLSAVPAVWFVWHGPRKRK